MGPASPNPAVAPTPSPSRKASAVKLQIWDSAGQERFRSVTRSYYRGAAGALLVYDVTKRSTFESLPTWLADVRSLASDQLMVVVVGNKTDLDGGGGGGSDGSAKRQVEWEEGRRWAESEGKQERVAWNKNKTPTADH